MRDKLIVVEDFFDDPDAVKNCALDIFNSIYDSFINDTTQNYPGCRTDVLANCAPHIQKELKEKLEYHVGKKCSDLRSCFHITNSIHGLGMVHCDSGYRNLVGLVYLNEFYPENTGTKIVKCKMKNIPHDPDRVSRFYESCTTKNCDTIQSFVDYKKNNYNTLYKDSIVVQGEYNRMITYDSGFYHTPDNYFGFNLYNSRLTLPFFANT